MALGSSPDTLTFSTGNILLRGDTEARGTAPGAATPGPGSPSPPAGRQAAGTRVGRQRGWRSPSLPAVLGDDHLVGELLEAQPQVAVLQRDAQLPLRGVALLTARLQLALHGAQQVIHAVLRGLARALRAGGAHPGPAPARGAAPWRGRGNYAEPSPSRLPAPSAPGPLL